MKNQFKIILWSILFSWGIIDVMVAQVAVAPSNLVATPKSSSQIDLTWKDNDNNETGFDVQWGENTSYSSGSASINTKNVVAHSVMGLKANTKYYFRVRSKIAAPASVSAWATAEATTFGSPPAAPSGLNLSVQNNGTQLVVSWKDNSSDETNFDVEWGQNPNYGSSAVVGANVISFNITTEPCKPYNVRVKARNGVGSSAWVDKKEDTDIAVPSVPSNLNSSVVSSTQINLSWVDNSMAESNFVVQYADNNAFTNFTEAVLNSNTQSYSLMNLKASTAYWFRVKARNCGGESSWITNNATTQAPPVALPSAPMGLSVVVVSSSQIDIGWQTGSGGGQPTNFDWQCSTDNTFATVTKSGNTGGKEASATGLNPTTLYYIRVRAKNSAGNSGWSNVVNATTQSPPVTVPSAPTNLSASAVSSSQINLSWNDTSNNETGFDIERSIDGSTFSALASVGAGTTTYQSSGLVSNTKYYYRVRSKNSAGNSGWSNVSEATTQSPPVTIPSAPSSLSVSAVSSSQINLSWNDTSNNETGFDIERSGDGSNFSTLASVGANTITYQSTGLVSNTKYYYRVRSKNSAGNSAWSNVADATTQSPPVTVPSAPTNLSASAVSSSQINLIWNDNSNNETGFDIERSSDGSSFIALASVGAGTTTYQSSGLVSNTKYYYRVRSKNSAGNSGWSNVADATTQSPPVTIPSAPSSLSVSAVSSSQINLSWNDNSNNETGFDIERSGDGSNFIALASVDANVTTYQSTGLASNTKYYYRVRSKNSAGNSAWSNVADATTQSPPVTVPSAPTSLLSSVVSSSQINLIWNDNSSNETGFDIERSGDGSNFIALASVDANVTTYQSTGLASNTKYWYRVRSKNSAGNSGWSNVADATTQSPPVTVPSAPTSLSSSTVSSSQINLSWNDNSNNETGFDIERSNDGSSFSALASVDANVTTYQSTGLASNTKYWYRVRSKNSAGNSAWSNVADATTQSPPVIALATPTRLRQKSGNPVINELSLEWDDNADNETAYELSRSINTETNWEIIQANLPANTKEYVDKSLRSGFKYYYRVRTVKTGAFSEYSNVLALNAPLVSSISTPFSEDITVYPNPFSSYLYLKTTQGRVKSVEVLNLMGVVVKEWTNPVSHSFEVADLPTGIYFLRINQGAELNTVKIFKQ